jgi:hypothetical protein
MSQCLERIGHVRIVSLIAALLLLAVSGCAADSLTGGGDKSEEIAQATGAESCTQTEYVLTSKLDNSSAPVYDCIIDGADKCVTYEGGIARDETALAKILFDQNLSGGRPECSR